MLKLQNAHVILMVQREETYVPTIPMGTVGAKLVQRVPIAKNAKMDTGILDNKQTQVAEVS